MFLSSTCENNEYKRYKQYVRRRRRPDICLSGAPENGPPHGSEGVHTLLCIGHYCGLSAAGSDLLNPMKFKVRLAGVSTPQTDSKQSHDIAMGLKIERQNLRGF